MLQTGARPGDGGGNSEDNGHIRLCPTEAVAEGSPVLVNVENRPALVVYRFEEAYFVSEALCTHGKALLSDGYQEGPVIECPLHGGSFDIRSGAPLTPPCQLALRTYDAIVQNGWIAIANGGA